MTDPASAVQCSPPGLAWLPQHWPSHTLQGISSGGLPASQISSLPPAIPQVEVMEVEEEVEVVLTVAGLAEQLWPWGGGGPSVVQQYSGPGQCWSCWSHDRQITVLLHLTNTQGCRANTGDNTFSIYRSDQLLCRRQRDREREREIEPMMVPRLSAHLVV